MLDKTKLFLILILFTSSIFSQNIADITISNHIEPFKALDDNYIQGPVSKPGLVSLKSGTSLVTYDPGVEINSLKARIFAKDSTLLYEKTKSYDDFGSFRIRDLCTNNNDMFLLSWSETDADTEKFFVEVIDSSGNILLEDYIVFQTDAIYFDIKAFFTPDNYIVYSWYSNVGNDSEGYCRYFDPFTKTLYDPILLYDGWLDTDQLLSEVDNNNNLKIIRRVGPSFYSYSCSKDSLLHADYYRFFLYDYDDDDNEIFYFIDDYSKNWLLIKERNGGPYNLVLYKFSENFDSLETTSTIVSDIRHAAIPFISFEEDSVMISYGTAYPANSLVFGKSDTSAVFNSFTTLIEDYDYRNKVSFVSDGLVVHQYYSNLCHITRMNYNGDIFEEHLTATNVITVNPSYENVTFSDFGKTMLLFTRMEYGGNSRHCYIIFDDEGNVLKDETTFVEVGDQSYKTMFDGCFIDENRFLISWVESNSLSMKSQKVRIFSLDNDSLSYDLTIAENMSDIYGISKPQIISDSIATIAFNVKNEEDYANLYYSVINLNSYTASEPIIVNKQLTYPSYFDYYPQYDVNSNGDGIAVWTDVRELPSRKIYARRFGQDGLPLADSVELLTNWNPNDREVVVQGLSLNDDLSMTFTTIDSWQFYRIYYVNQNGSQQYEEETFLQRDPLIDPPPYYNLHLFNDQYDRESIHFQNNYVKEDYCVLATPNNTALFVKKFDMKTDPEESIISAKGRIYDDKIYSVQYIRNPEFSGSYIQYRCDTYEKQFITDLETATPENFFMLSNYPNPFNPETTIRFNLPDAGNAKLTVYNVLGEQVANLVSRELKAGQHNVTFNATNLASGVYIARLDFDSGSEAMNKTIKMLVLK